MHVVSPALFEFIVSACISKRKTQEFKIHISKIECSKSVTSIYSQEFRFSCPLQITLFK